MSELQQKKYIILNEFTEQNIDYLETKVKQEEIINKINKINKNIENMEGIIMNNEMDIQIIQEKLIQIKKQELIKIKKQNKINNIIALNQLDIYNKLKLMNEKINLNHNIILCILICILICIIIVIKFL